MGVYRKCLGVCNVFDRNDYRQYRSTPVLDGFRCAFIVKKGVMAEGVWKENPSFYRRPDHIFCDQILLSMYSGGM